MKAIQGIRHTRQFEGGSVGCIVARFVQEFLAAFNPTTASGPIAALEAMHEKKYPLVDDPRDSRFLHLRSLQTPDGRLRTGLYLIEGIRHLAQAIENHAPIESIFYDPSVLSNRFGRKLAGKLRESGIPGIRLSSRLYRHLTLAAEPQGIGAILQQLHPPLSGMRVARDSIWLGIESIESPGNLGTILRTAEATGVAGIFLLGETADPWDPAAVRASMGSLFSQKFFRCAVHEFGDWAKGSKVSVVGSSPRGLLNYRDFPVQGPSVILLGSEKLGLSEQLMELCDFVVRIPMVGRCDSINVAVAAGVLLFEMSHQCRVRR